MQKDEETMLREMTFHWETTLGKALLAAGAAVLAVWALAANARAADLRGGYKDGPAVDSVQVVNWTGGYVGAGLGYSSGLSSLAAEASVFDLSAGVNTDTGMTGFIGELTAGADWHVPSSRWVFGVYADYTFGDRSGDVFGLTVNGAHAAVESTLDNQWALGGRIGLLVTPGALAYVKAGYTQADASLALTTPNGSSDAWKEAVGGYQIGGGAELALASGFFLRGEYMYSDFGSTTLVNEQIPGVGGLTITDDLSDNRFTAALIYKIGGLR